MEFEAKKLVTVGEARHCDLPACNLDKTQGKEFVRINIMSSFTCEENCLPEFVPSWSVSLTFSSHALSPLA